MNSFIKPRKSNLRVPTKQLAQNDLNIAVQSALAAAFCLGLPAGLLFWLITVQRWIPSATIDRLVRFFFDHLVPPVMLEMIGAFGGYLSQQWLEYG
jgi:hypothetical protein